MNISLDALAQALPPEGYKSIWATEVCVSLLLSLVSTGKEDRESEEGLQEAGLEISQTRKSIHVLLAAPAFCSVASRLLLVGAVLSPRSICFDAKNKNVIARASAVDDKTGVISVSAGSMALANDGVCVVNISRGSLRKDVVEQLRHCMDKEVTPAADRTELSVATRGAVWAFFTSESSKTSLLREGSACLYREPGLDPRLLSSFDIVHRLSAFEGREADRRASAELLESTEDHTAPEVAENLKVHLMRAGLLPSPRVSQDARELLQTYYMMVRRSQSLGAENAYVSLATLEGLMRIATASARLFLRDEVLEMPDATLAIYMHEKSLEAKVSNRNLGYVTGNP